MSLRDTCYWPNGTAVATDSDLAPCPRSSGRANSMCCATVNRAQPDFCQMYSNNDPNGLCMGGSGDSGVWRNACTDRNWGSDCLNLCANGEGAADDQYYGDMAKSSWPITPCGNGMYCCGRGQAATRCCRDKTGYYIVNVSSHLLTVFSRRDIDFGRILVSRRSQRRSNLKAPQQRQPLLSRAHPHHQLH